VSDKDLKEDFKVQDKRHFDREGNLVRESEESGEPAPDRSAEEKITAPPPPEKVDFLSILFSYFHTALIHLGDVEDPLENKKHENLEGARQMIDTLELFEAKTKGNLTKEEAEFLERALYDLRMRFVQKAKGSK